MSWQLTIWHLAIFQRFDGIRSEGIDIALRSLDKERESQNTRG